MFVTICGRFCPEEGVVASYDNRIRAKYTAKWGVQIVGMLFQTRSNTDFFNPLLLFITTIQQVLFRKVLLRRN